MTRSRDSRARRGEGGEQGQRRQREGGAPRQQKPRGERRLYLKLSPEQHDAVLAILAETPGRIPVVLVEIDAGGGRNVIGLDRMLWVDEGYDFGALANLIGPDSIVLR